MVDTLKTKENGRAASQVKNSKIRWDKDVIFGYFREMKTLAGKSNKDIGEGVMPKNLGRSFMTIIGDVDLLKSDKCHYRRILNQCKLQFINGALVTSNNPNLPSDLDNDLQFRPTLIFAEKISEIFCHIRIGELDSAKSNLHDLHLMRESPFFILWHADLDEAILFVEKTFHGLFNWINGESFGADTVQNMIPSANDLSVKADLTLKVMRAHLLGNFRVKHGERLQMLKDVIDSDCSEVEWLITTFEGVRKKRDVPKYVRNGRQSAEEDEHVLVDSAMKLDDQNPFVRFAVLDCIVDCLRDSRKSFTCGGVTFHTNTSHIIVFMKQTCREILAEFPRNIKFHSRVSDYFARFVTLRFFDVAYAEECLEIAYKLNPTYPLTTHRLGIFSRMSKGALSTSFEWFRKTEALDPYHYNAFLECVKNMIGHPQIYNTANVIEEKLRTAGACAWTDCEILELLFYKGISHFVRSEPEEALQAWIHVAIQYQPHFRLIDLDQVCGFYQWDMDLISSDKLRLWMHEEVLKEDQDPSRKLLVNRLYNLMTGKVMAEKPRLPFQPLSCATYFQEKRHAQI